MRRGPTAVRRRHRRVAPIGRPRPVLLPGDKTSRFAGPGIVLGAGDRPAANAACGHEDENQPPEHRHLPWSNGGDRGSATSRVRSSQPNAHRDSREPGSHHPYRTHRSCGFCQFQRFRKLYQSWKMENLPSRRRMGNSTRSRSNPDRPDQIDQQRIEECGPAARSLSPRVRTFRWLRQFGEIFGAASTQPR